MPLELNEIVEIVVQSEVKKSYDKIIVSGHYANNKNGELHIIYDTFLNGELVSNGLSVLISGDKFMEMLGRNPNLYETLKGVLYAELALALGVQGNVI